MDHEEANPRVLELDPGQRLVRRRVERLNRPRRDYVRPFSE
jgi:hypothetical protein